MSKYVFKSLFQRTTWSQLNPQVCDTVTLGRGAGPPQGHRADHLRNGATGGAVTGTRVPVCGEAEHRGDYGPEGQVVRCPTWLTSSLLGSGEN